tara:strand:+ start:376 stop:600 length:225 start_codon:yes stop_codon:yes gene_type:complete
MSSTIYETAQDYRRCYIIAKALVSLEQELNDVTDIRYREDSDLADVRELLKSGEYSAMADVIRIQKSYQPKEGA